MADRLAPLLARFRLSASVFHSGALCGLAAFNESDGVGHLHLVDRGEVFLSARAGGELNALPVPALVLFAKPTSHRLFVPEDREATLLCASVRFGGGNDPITQSLPSPLVLNLSKAPALHALARLLFDEAFSEHCGRQQALYRLAELLIIHLLRHVLDDGLMERGVLSGLGDPRLSKALGAVHGHPAESWTLVRLADAAGMSRARFAAHFLSVVGQTPGRYISSYRLALADASLKRGRPLKQVAVEVGYGSASALARAFKTRHIA